MDTNPDSPDACDLEDKDSDDSNLTNLLPGNKFFDRRRLLPWENASSRPPSVPSSPASFHAGQDVRVSHPLSLRPTSVRRPRIAKPTGLRCVVCSLPTASIFIRTCLHFYCETCVSEWLHVHSTCHSCSTRISSSDLKKVR